MAQLGARLNGIEKVRGSNPLRSTNGAECRLLPLGAANTGGNTEQPFVPHRDEGHFYLGSIRNNFVDDRRNSP